MTEPLPLLRVSAQLKVLALEADTSAAADIAAGWIESGLTARVVRGLKMRNLGGLFDEFAAALQFPWYLGENGAASNESLTGLSWLPPHAGYVLVVSPTRSRARTRSGPHGPSLANGGTAWQYLSTSSCGRLRQTYLRSGLDCKQRVR